MIKEQLLGLNMANTENRLLLKFWGTFLTVQSYYKPVPYATAVKTFSTVTYITNLLKLLSKIRDATKNDESQTNISQI